jgi:DNA-binding response OmpR family regulator
MNDMHWGGSDGLFKAAGTEYDAIALDLMLPGMSG